MTGIPLKEDPSDNAWHVSAKVQIRDDVLEDMSLDEQSYVLTCEQLNGSCILMTYINQNELTVQNLQLSDIVQILLETFLGTPQKADDMGSIDTSKNRKTKEKPKAYPSQEE